MEFSTTRSNNGFKGGSSKSVMKTTNGRRLFSGIAMAPADGKHTYESVLMIVEDPMWVSRIVTVLGVTI